MMGGGGGGESGTGRHGHVQGAGGEARAGVAADALQAAAGNQSEAARKLGPLARDLHRQVQALRAVSDARQRPRQGPQIAKVRPGSWMLTNSVCPSGENVAPANSASLAGLSANGNVRPSSLIADQPLVVFAVGAGEREAVRAGRDVVRAVERAAGREQHDELDRLGVAGRSARSARCAGRRCGPLRPRRRGRRRGSTRTRSLPSSPVHTPSAFMIGVAPAAITCSRTGVSLSPGSGFGTATQRTPSTVPGVLHDRQVGVDARDRHRREAAARVQAAAPAQRPLGRKR